MKKSVNASVIFLQTIESDKYLAYLCTTSDFNIEFIIKPTH